jgi:hypothetical protein
MNCRVLKAAMPYLALLSLVSSCIGDSKTATISVSATPSPTATSTPCSGGSYNILVSWSANREKAVNTTGGGYLVYYSTTTPVNTSTATSVDVPYVSGSTSPTSKTITGLSCGTWHFRVVAYSAIHPSGSSSGSRSADSSEVTVTVP